MLVILTPEQTVKYWDEMKGYIELALPVHLQRGYSMPSMQMNALGGVLLSAFLTDSEGIIIAVFSFTVRRDSVTGVNNLEITTGFSERMLKKEEVEDMMLTFKRYAKDKGCGQILFYTDIKEAKEAFKGGGAEEHTLLTWEV